MNELTLVNQNKITEVIEQKTALALPLTVIINPASGTRLVHLSDIHTRVGDDGNPV